MATQSREQHGEFFLTSSEGTNTVDTLILKLQLSEGGDGEFCCLKHPAYGTLFWQAWKMNTGGLWD